MNSRIDTRLLLAGILTLQIVILIYGGWGCGNTEEKKPESAGESVFTLPKDALGNFTGEESGYQLDAGRNRVQVPSSWWVLQMTDVKIFLKQTSEAGSFHYNGPFVIESDEDTALIITANLSEARSKALFTPKLHYSKIERHWILESSLSEQGVILKGK